MHLKIVIFIIVFSVLSKINSQTAKVDFIILDSKVKKLKLLYILSCNK